MPQRRRTNYRRRTTYRRRPQKGRLATARKMTGAEPNTTMDKIASGVGTVASIARTVSGIVSMINVEDKYQDTNIGLTLSVGAPQGATLNATVQGTDRNQRNGNKILNKCLQVNLSITLNAAATALAVNTVRIIILIDKKPQINTIGFNTVYTPTGDVNALIDKDSAGDRVVILKDKRFILTGSDKRQYTFKWYMSLARLHTQYTGPTAAFEEGEIRLLAMSDLAGLQPNITVLGNTRFCYLDN